MMQHDPHIRLRHMLDHAREAVGLIRGRQRSDLDVDRMLELPLVRTVEIMGEAGLRIPRAGQIRYPTVLRPQVTRMRPRLIHGYDAADLQVRLGHRDR